MRVWTVRELVLFLGCAALAKPGKGEGAGLGRRKSSKILGVQLAAAGRKVARMDSASDRARINERPSPKRESES